MIVAEVFFEKTTRFANPNQGNGNTSRKIGKENPYERIGSSAHIKSFRH